MKCLILSGSLLVLSLFVSAQIDSITYGLSAINSGSGLFLSKINPQTGYVTKISPSAAVFNASIYGKTIDPQNHIFYYISDSILLSFNLTSGELLVAKTVLNYENSKFCGITYNCWDTTLYGLDIDISGQTVKLAKISPYNGIVVGLSPNSIASSYSVLTGSTLDPFKEIYYFETSLNPGNHLIGINLKSGLVVSDVVIPILATDRFGPIVFNCHDSTLYGLVGNMTDGRRLSKIDPSSGLITTISQNVIVYSILNEQATIDPFEAVYFFEGSNYSYNGVTLYSGELISQPIITPISGSFFTGFQYNSTCYSEIPLIIMEKKGEHSTIVYPNPATDFITISSTEILTNIMVINSSGEVVVSFKGIGANIMKIDLDSFRDGLYFIISNKTSSVTTSKFLKVNNQIDKTSMQ